MVQLSGGIGNVTTNTGLVEMAMAYSRSRMLLVGTKLGTIENSPKKRPQKVKRESRVSLLQ